MDADEARELSDQLVLHECERRRRLYAALTPYPDEPPDVQQDKIVLCLQQWLAWKADRISFIRDMAWVPDPRGLFGGRGKIPPALAPPRMVPFMLYVPQRDFLKSVLDCSSHDGALHLNIVKDRQVAATSGTLLADWSSWLMDDGFALLLGSYEKEAIDAGGKGNREGDTLFGRFRMFNDAMVWSLPHCAFNLHRNRRWVSEQRRKENLCLFDESDDTAARIVRPRWTVFGQEMFRGARGNYARGVVPSDKFGKSQTFSKALLDEFGEYDRLGPGVDKKARDAVIACCDHVQTQGTIPEGGGLGSHFKELWDRGDTETLRNLEIAWSDLPNYMLGAFFYCSACGERADYGDPAPPPGKDGIAKRCGCGAESLVTRDSVTSPWFERKKDEYGHDTVAIARYFQRKWLGAAADRAFPSFNPARQVVGRAPSPGALTVHGYDPGHSEKNPHAWSVVRWDPRAQRPTVVAWHMAAEWPTQKWVPFFKCWHPSQLQRMRVLYGSADEIGKTFAQAFRYREEELGILARIAEYQHGEAVWRGDAYGSNSSAGTEPAFRILQRYGVRFRFTRDKDREPLVRKMQDVWVGRFRIEDFAARHRPWRKGGHYPTIVECLQTAQMVSSDGQGETRHDVSAKLPSRYVKQAVDSLTYTIREFPAFVRGVPDEGGAFSADADRPCEVVRRGERWESFAD